MAVDEGLTELRMIEDPDGREPGGTRLPTPENLDLSDLKRAVEQGRVVSSIAPGTSVEIDRLGSFTVHEERWSADIQEILIEHWSHRIVARQMGEELPTITVPKAEKKPEQSKRPKNKS